MRAEPSREIQYPQQQLVDSGAQWWRGFDTTGTPAVSSGTGTLWRRERGKGKEMELFVSVSLLLWFRESSRFDLIVNP